jgi:hypothetical protein
MVLSLLQFLRNAALNLTKYISERPEMTLKH